MSIYGIIGNGVVGKSIKNGFSRNNISTWTYDKFNEQFKFPDNETLSATRVILVAVPTPPLEGVGYNLENLLDVLNKLNSSKFSGSVILLSTISPSDFNLLTPSCETFELFVSPEFLTEKNAEEDFYNSSEII